MAGHISRGPPGKLLYAVGDIHGRADLLERLLTQIRADAEASQVREQAVICFLGDYVDRGVQVREVIETILNLRSEGVFRVATIRGNHDQFLLDFLLNSQSGTAWMEFGGGTTLASYGIQRPLRRSDSSTWLTVSAQLNRAMPSAHKRFFADTVLGARFGDYLLVHAGVRPEIPIEDQVPGDLMGIREKFLTHPNPIPGMTVVFGHTPTDQPTMSEAKIGIDTGAYATGILTALRIYECDRKLIQTTPSP